MLFQVKFHLFHDSLFFFCFTSFFHSCIYCLVFMFSVYQTIFTEFCVFIFIQRLLALYNDLKFCFCILAQSLLFSFRLINVCFFFVDSLSAAVNFICPNASWVWNTKHHQKLCREEVEEVVKRDVQMFVYNSMFVYILVVEKSFLLQCAFVFSLFLSLLSFFLGGCSQNLCTLYSSFWMKSFSTIQFYPFLFALVSDVLRMMILFTYECFKWIFKHEMCTNTFTHTK